MTIAVKTQKKQSAVRGQGSLNVPGKSDWKEKVRQQGLKRQAKKKQEEERMTGTKLAEKRKKKESKLEAEVNELMDKENEVEEIVQKGKKEGKKVKKNEQTVKKSKKKANNTITTNGETRVKYEIPKEPLSEILVKAERKTWILTRDQMVAEAALAYGLKVYFLTADSEKIPGAHIVRSFQEIAVEEGEVVVTRTPRAGVKKVQEDGYVKIVAKKGKFVNFHQNKKKGSYIAFEELRKGGKLSEIITRTFRAFEKVGCQSNPQSRVKIMIGCVRRGLKNGAMDYSKFEVIRREEKEKK